MVLCGLVYILAMFSIICLYRHIRHTTTTDHGSRNHAIFLLMIVMGTVCTNTASVFFTQANRPQTTAETEKNANSLDTACLAAPWFLILGHMITTGMLVARMMQVRQQQHRQQEQGPVPEQRPQNTEEHSLIELKYVIMETTSLLLVNMIVLTIWSMVDPLRFEVDATVWDDHGYIVEASGQCGGEHDLSLLFPLGMALFHGAVLLHGNLLSYQTRDSHKIIPGLQSFPCNSYS
jgi:7 transmembrane sweet-taste receptor of 3 GCPR